MKSMLKNLQNFGMIEIAKITSLSEEEIKNIFKTI